MVLTKAAQKSPSILGVLSRLASIPSATHLNMPLLDPSTNAEPFVARRLRKRHALPAVMMRSGTSKGLFIHRHNLPTNMKDWDTPLLAAMGSKNGEPRQIDGVGGATSTTSKVIVVSPSQIPGVDVDYTFAQVSVGSETVDYSGNCGNMASGVGPFALQEGLVQSKPGQKTMDISIFNTNTSRKLVATVELDDQGYFAEDGTYTIAGVKSAGSEVKVSFIDPSGSMTGKLFPTGQREEVLEIAVPPKGQLPFAVRATLIDAANPFIFVDSQTLPLQLHQKDRNSPEMIEFVEAIRRAGAVRMGLAKDVDTAGLRRGTPKIALLATPLRQHGSQTPDINVTAFSMGNPHPTLQLTGAVCLGTARCIEGTVAYRLARGDANPLLPSPERTPSPSDDEDKQRYRKQGQNGKAERKIVDIEHSTGIISSYVELQSAWDDITVKSGTISRTVRRLFEGNVLYYM